MHIHMANQVKPLTVFAPGEHKEVNRENYKDCFELSQREVSRLTAENKELVLKSEKLSKKLDKKKSELEIEKTNSVTFRQLIQELNTKVQLLERASIPVSNPSIPLSHNPILNTTLSEEFVEKLVIEKTGLESQVCEQKREIEFLNSELISSRNLHFTEYQEFAPNQELSQVRTDLAIKEQELVECKASCLTKEAECKLGKQLFQEAISSLSADKEQRQLIIDRERSVSGKLGLEIERDKELIRIQRTNLIEQVATMDTLRSNEKELQTQIDKLQTENIQLKNNANSLRDRIELNENIRSLQEKVGDLEQREFELNDLKVTFGIMSKESNKLTEENGDMRTKQLACEEQIIGLHETTREWEIRNQELSSELSELKHSSSVIKEGQFDSLMTENSKLQDLNKQLSEDLMKRQIELNARIEELTESKEKEKPSMPINTSKTKEDKKEQIKQKHPDTSGATPGATLPELTPQIVPVVNKSGKSPLKFNLRPGIPVSAAKLKALPNPSEYRGKQVICLVNKRYELGILMTLFELQTRLSMRILIVKYVGIKLYNPVGNSDGEFRTKRYFECEPHFGIFVPFEDVLIPVI